MKKDQKKEEEKTILINLVVLIIIFSAGYLIFNKLELQNQEIKTTLENQQEKTKELEQKISNLEEVNKESLAKLETDLLAEKTKRESSEVELKKQKEISQQQISELEEKIVQSGEKDLNNIVDIWDSYVVFVECDFYYKDGLFAAEMSGSGLIVEWDNTDPLILTNKHIIATTVGGSGLIAKSCEIRFPKENVTITSTNVSVADGGLDWGFIDLGKSNIFVNDLLINPPSVCKEDPGLGDELVILGYPSIGDENNVTATEGIVSGFDGNYFITSAKVEKGNSGGAAISLEDNCYLGTPTFSTAGDLESLARILDVKVLFE